MTDDRELGTAVRDLVADDHPHLDNTLFAADPCTVADHVRRHTVRTAITALVVDHPQLADQDDPRKLVRQSVQFDLLRSVKRCARLDNRPLAADRVRDRARALVARWGISPDLVISASGEELVWTPVEIQVGAVAS